jgi:DNA-binding PadR family transcriptional regulator
MDHALLVLGLLKLQEMHGYQLNDLIDRRLSYITDLKKPTLYHLLAKLEKAGAVSKRASRAGNRPERHTYRLTPAGEKQFAELLRQNLEQAHTAYFNDDIGLLFIGELPVDQARAYLEKKRGSVDERITHIRTALALHQAGTPAYFTLFHHELHLRAERSWLNELLAQLGKRAVRGDILECLDAAEPNAVAADKLSTKNPIQTNSPTKD